MTHGEYLTVINDYTRRADARELTPALQNQLPTTLCKERVSLKNTSRPMPKTPLEEVLFWRLSLLSSDSK